MAECLHLEQILKLLPQYKVKGNTDIKILGLTADSRRIEQGWAFICLTGNTVDGHDYIAAAYEKGAAVVFAEKNIEFNGLTIVEVPDTRSAMQIIAPYFYGYPSQKLRLIGITGTNGKTTTSYLIRDILNQAGYKTGLIGTIEAIIGDKKIPVKNTTPDVIDLQQLLAEMVLSGIDYVVMEVSSHALKLKRTAGCEYDVCVFTNITQDHLDFHLTFEDYLESKALLFKNLGFDDPDSLMNCRKNKKTAVVNLDDAAGASMLKLSDCLDRQDRRDCQAISYGIEKLADITAENISVNSRGVNFDLKGNSFGAIPVSLKITGLFNVYNTLAAIGTTLAENIDIKVICRAIENFTSVRGRFELINEGQPFAVIVDYAHTPDGLENVLKTAGEFVKGRIIVVFGCGGDRDRTKRPIMGRLAAKYADIIIATSDNPRSEDPVKILNDIESGIKKELEELEELSSGSFPGAKQYEIIPDRKQAICRAINIAEGKDAVLILGKGHETYQILKNQTIEFDDREVVRTMIREMG